MGAQENLKVAETLINNIQIAEYYHENFAKKQELQVKADDLEYKINHHSPSLYTHNLDKLKNRNDKINKVLFSIFSIFIRLIPFGILAYFFLSFGNQYVEVVESMINSSTLAEYLGKDQMAFLNEMKNGINVFFYISIAWVLWFPLLFKFGKIYKIIFFVILAFLALYFVGLIVYPIHESIFSPDFLGEGQAQVITDSLAQQHAALLPCLLIAGGMILYPVVSYLINHFLTRKIIFSFSARRNKKAQKKAQKKDEKYFNENSERILNNYKESLSDIKKTIAMYDDKLNLDVVISAKKQIENLSPIYCEDIISIHPTNAYINIEKLSQLKVIINECIEIIKSGRALDISSALNVIENDKINKKLLEEQQKLTEIERERLGNEKAYQEKLLKEQKELLQERNEHLKDLKDDIHRATTPVSSWDIFWGNY